MSAVVEALGDGARRLSAARALFAALWLLTIVAAVQVAFALGSIGAWSAANAVLLLVAQPTDGAALTLYRLSRETAAIGAVPVVVWLFLSGGIIDRYARDRATRADGFFAACGVFFPRFVRIAIVQAIVYAAVVRAVTAPRALALAMAACSVFFDYAKVRAVVEDRRSMIGAIAAAVAFVKRNAVPALTLYAIEFAIFLVVFGAFRRVAPTGAPTSIAALFAAVYVAVRLWVRLLFWASETALFQTRLAHAGYVARRETVWPESPMAEQLQ